MLKVEPLIASGTLTEVVSRFRQGVPLGMLPVVDDGGWVLGAMPPEEQADLWMVTEGGYHGVIFEGLTIDHQNCADYAAGEYELPCDPTEEWMGTDTICSMDRDTQTRIDMLLRMGEVDALKAITAEVTERMRELYHGTGK